MIRIGTLFLALIVAPRVYGANAITPIAVSYSSTLRPPGGSDYWQDLRTPSIDNQGNVAFRGFVGPSNSNDGINSAYRTSSDRYIAQAGAQAPGLANGVIFNSLTNLRINPQGPGAFLGHVSIDDRPAAGIWAENADGTLRLVALDGTQPPGVPDGVTLSSFEDQIVDAAPSRLPPLFTINGRGETAFYSELDLPGAPMPTSGIWSEGGGRGLRLVARTGMPAPQFQEGARFCCFEMDVPMVPINDRGMTTFVARVEGPGIDNGLALGVFVDDPSLGLLVAGRGGQLPPGLSPGSSFGSFWSPRLNNAGQIVFSATFEGVEAGANAGTGIWSGLPDELHLVARTGGPAPGVESTFSQISPWTPAVINGRGRVAFAAAITGPGVDETNDTGIWAQDANGRLQLVVREGDLGEQDDFLSFSQRIYFNKRGQLAFTANSGIWATDLAGTIHRIADNSLGVFPSTGNEDGLGTSFNDRGEFVFLGSASNHRRGVFLSRTVAVPEPDSTMLALGALLVLVGVLRTARP